MEIERDTNLPTRIYVSSSLRDFLQRMLIEQIDSLNAKEQIFSCILL
jgi:hypothetical protein